MQNGSKFASKSFLSLAPLTLFMAVLIFSSCVKKEDASKLVGSAETEGEATATPTPTPASTTTVVGKGITLNIIGDRMISTARK